MRAAARAGGSDDADDASNRRREEEGEGGVAAAATAKAAAAAAAAAEGASGWPPPRSSLCVLLPVRLRVRVSLRVWKDPFPHLNVTFSRLCPMLGHLPSPFPLGDGGAPPQMAPS